MKTKRTIINSGLASFHEDEIGKNIGANDKEIKSTILSSLNWYSFSPIEEIKVAVDKGKVILTGQVPWMYQKMVIASIVLKSKGVQEVINKITVRNNLV